MNDIKHKVELSAKVMQAENQEWYYRVSTYNPETGLNGIHIEAYDWDVNEDEFIKCDEFSFAFVSDARVVAELILHLTEGMAEGE